MATLKPNFKRVHLDCTEIAKRLRKDLAVAFPCQKFSVRTSRFAGGSSVDIRWTDGPREHDVEPVCNRYKFRHFDGMTDSTYYTEDLVLVDGELVEYTGGAFVSCHREWSDATRDAIVAELNARYGTSADRRNDARVDCDGSSIWEPLGKSEYVWTLAHRKFARTELPSGRVACYYCNELPDGCKCNHD